MSTNAICSQKTLFTQLLLIDLYFYFACFNFSFEELWRRERHSTPGDAGKGDILS